MTVAVSTKRGRPGRSQRTVWVVAGDCAVVGLALSQVLRGDERLVAVGSLAVIAIVVALAELIRRGRSVERAAGLRAAARSGLLVVVLIAALVAAYRLLGVAVVGVGLAVFAGFALMAQWLVGVIERSSDARSPWQELSADEQPGDRPRPTVRILGAALGGALLLGASFAVLADDAVQTELGLEGFSGFVQGLLLFVGLAALVAGPLVLAAQAGARRDRELRDTALERQAVAAHLHDSVLQTLALIQRNAGDADQVVALARQQERGLRGWLAGREESPSSSLATALTAAVSEVEDASGVAIECVIAGDLPLDERTGALVRAVREALRNATSHGQGSDVRVFLQVDGAGAEAFVRDTGPGFDPDAIPVERRGVRDAIIGRMRHAGGNATIESDDAGTELVLRLPYRGERQ